MPYIGPVVSGTTLRTIAKWVQEALYQGTLAMDGTDLGITAAISPVELFVNAMDNARDAILSAPFILKASVAYVTR